LSTPARPYVGEKESLRVAAGDSDGAMRIERTGMAR